MCVSVQMHEWVYIYVITDKSLSKDDTYYLAMGKSYFQSMNTCVYGLLFMGTCINYVIQLF